jgi:hypothetical protein
MERKHNALRNLTIIIAYVAIMLFIYLLIALIGLIWFKWSEIIYSTLFNFLYFALIGWWLPAFVLSEEEL